MRHLLVLGLLAIPIWAQSTLEDFACDTATAISNASSAVITCNTPHGYGNGVRAWSNLAFKRIPINGDTITLDGSTYTFKTTLAGCSARDIFIEPSYVQNNMYNFEAGVNGEAGSGAVYCAGTTPHATMDTVVFSAAGGSPGAGNMYVRYRTGGTAGNGISVSTNDASTFTFDNGVSASSTLQMKWYVQFYGGTGAWGVVNSLQNVNSAKIRLMEDMSTTSSTMYVTDSSRVEPGNQCEIGVSLNTFGTGFLTPVENVTVGTPTDAHTVPITARAQSATPLNAHYAGDYSSGSPSTAAGTSSDTAVACSQVGAGRRGAWTATYVDANHFSIPLNSTALGAVTGTIRIERGSPLVVDTSPARGYPMWTAHGNFGAYVASMSGGYYNGTLPNVSNGGDGCTDPSHLGLIVCRSGWAPPYTAYTGLFPQARLTSISVTSGIGTLTLEGPYDENLGNAYLCSTGGRPPCVSGCGGPNQKCSWNAWANRLIYLQNLTVPTMNTYFVICDETTLKACGSSSITRDVSGKITAFKFFCKTRDGIVCPDGSILTTATSQVNFVLPQMVRMGMDYQAPGVPNSWGTTQGNNTKDSVPANDFNHLRFYAVSGGSQQRNLEGGFTTGSFGTYSATGAETVSNNNQITIGPTNSVYFGGANNWHYYYEPSCSRYAGQPLLVDINPTPHTQVNGDGTEVWVYDPIFNGHTWSTYQNYIPNGGETAHTLYQMYAWYFDNGGFRENFNGALSQGTTKMGPVKFYSVTHEPEEAVHAKVATWAPARYLPSTPGVMSGTQGYDVCWGSPKEIDGTRYSYEFRYSTTTDLKTLGFSNGTSGGTVSPPNNTNVGEYLNWQSPTMARANTMYIGIRPKFAIQACSGSGQNPIWCQPQNFKGLGVDPMFQAGDHVTVAGVVGNTAANQTAAVLSAVQPRTIYWLHDPRWTYNLGNGYADNGSDKVRLQVNNCCATNAPYAYKTGDMVGFAGTGAGKIDSVTGYPITVVDASHFDLTGPSWAATCGVAPGCLAGHNRKLAISSAHALISIVATGGGGPGESCQANLSDDPLGMYPGEFISVVYGAVTGLGSTGIKNYAISGVSHTNPFSITFNCPNVPEGTYNTEPPALTTSRMAIVTWPAFAVPGTGNGNYTSGGTIVATDDDRNFSEITFAPSATPTCTIITSSCPNAHTGVSYTCQVLTSGCTSPAHAITAGSLPSWASLNAGTGAITGTPSGPTPTLSSFTDTVTDVGGNPSQPLSIMDCVVPVITTTSPLPDATQGISYAKSFAATGDTPVTWTATNIPAGMAFSTTGNLTGAPTGSGATTINVIATNACGATAETVFSLTIQPTTPSGGPTTVIRGQVGINGQVQVK